MRHLYYYVRPCPKCGSHRTGHYMRNSVFGSTYSITSSLQHGEWVRLADGDPINNCFCLDCGYEWPDIVETRFLDDDALQKEKQERGTLSAWVEVQRQENSRKMSETARRHHGFLRNLFPRLPVPPKDPPKSVEEILENGKKMEEDKK